MKQRTERTAEQTLVGAHGFAAGQQRQQQKIGKHRRRDALRPRARRALNGVQRRFRINQQQYKRNQRENQPPHASPPSFKRYAGRGGI